MINKHIGTPFLALLFSTLFAGGLPSFHPVVNFKIITNDSTGTRKPINGNEASSNQKKAAAKLNDKSTAAPLDNSRSKAFSGYLKQLSESEMQEENLYLATEDLKKDLKKNEQSLTQVDAQKTMLKEKIAPLVSAKNGSDTITFKGTQYYVFIADLDSCDIRLHWKDAKNKIYGNIGNLLHAPIFRDNSPAMITNGGMFYPDISPEGLLVENGVTKALLNTDKPNNENFYLKPNGIFYIQKDGSAHIDTTSETFKTNIPQIDQATQSGPMLVINGKIHDKFARASTNKKLRSGVGIISARKVVFIISKGDVNFYDFAVLFKDVYNCQNALFLDGAISMMYLRDFLPNETGGHFCTLISATKKKRTK